MLRKLSDLLLITGIFVSSLSASDLSFGIFIGVNEFRTEPQEYYGPWDLYENHLGHYYFDESGSTFQAGVQMLFGDHIGLRLQYRTPRQGISYFFSTDYPGYPSEENLRHITVVRSYLSSISSEIRYYFIPDMDLSPYFGIGIDLSILNVDEHEINSITYWYPWLSIPDKYFTHLGTKILGGLILPAGVLINLSDHIKIDLGLNYTFMRINQWDHVTDVPVEQDMGGLYLNIGLMYNFSLK
jgi:opacity protein-like surface antigen